MSLFCAVSLFGMCPCFLRCPSFGMCPCFVLHISFGMCPCFVRYSLQLCALTYVAWTRRHNCTPSYSYSGSMGEALQRIKNKKTKRFNWCLTSDAFVLSSKVERKLSPSEAILDGDDSGTSRPMTRVESSVHVLGSECLRVKGTGWAVTMLRGARSLLSPHLDDAVRQSVILWL